MKKRLAAIFIACLTLLPMLAAARPDASAVSYGDRTEDAVRVQKRLEDLGYYTYKATGHAGSTTSNAIMLFQGMLGDEKTGDLTEEEWTVLFSDAAPLRPFTSSFTLRYTAQSSRFTVTGELVPWEEIRPLLVQNKRYRITDCAGGRFVMATFTGGESHAEMSVIRNSVEAEYLKTWLGITDSNYKMSAVIEVEGKQCACSLQWDGSTRLHVYLYGSTSAVHGLKDVEHNSCILKAAGKKETETAG